MVYKLVKHSLGKNRFIVYSKIDNLMLFLWQFSIQQKGSLKHTHTNTLMANYLQIMRKEKLFFSNMFFGVPHLATFIFKFSFLCNSLHYWLHPSSIRCRGLNSWPLGHEPSALITRPVFLKPGVATHLCVDKILQCVAKNFNCNPWNYE
jgi:hypothetical protein